MEERKMAPEAGSLLKSYKWRMGPQELERHPTLPGGSKRWTKLQHWKRSQSQQESDVLEDAPERPGGRAAARRSVFQRAFSAPAKAPKSQECGGGGGGRLNLRKYLRSMSHRRGQESGLRAPQEPEKGASFPAQPAPQTLTSNPPIWDVANISLLEGRLVLLGREEEGPCRKRTSSCVSETSSLKPLSYQLEPCPDRRSQSGTQDPGRGSDHEGPSGSQVNNVKGLLWKRIRERKARPPTRADPPAGPDGERDAVPGPAQLLDLASEKDVLIRPVHSSLLGEQYCFEVVSTGGRRCFGCASATERDRWIENLRRAAQPSKDNCERVEHALSLWVYEGRDLPLRRRFLCELHLDGVLYARTTAKQADPSGTLFWGERFDLETLPPAQELRVSLRREGSSLGSVAIPLTELAAARQALERWYPVCRERPGAPALRLRGRYRCTRVLPIVQYKEFAEYLTFHYRELCARLEHATSAREKEEMASALVRVLQSTGKAKEFLIDLGVAELDRFGEREALIFRENTLATKAIDEYMKLVGGPYLLATLGEAIARLYASEDCCEVDPGKCSACDLSDNQNNLRQNCEEVFQRITASGHRFPAELNEIFAAWQEECDARGKEALGQRLISASLFLRFLCPAIMSPSLFGLTQEYPGDATSRTLTLMAKVIQNLANLAAFGEKEAYMNFMNGFLEQNWEGMRSFLGSVASPEGALHLEAYDGSIDLALELSGLHALLCDIIAALDQRTQNQLEPLPTILHAIREGTPVPISVQLGPRTEEREAEKPGFVPPRELSKHTPLIKSHSMTNIQKGRGREPEPLPSTPPAQARTLVQRTQSVPAQSKGARRLLKQGSMDCQPPEAGSLSAESQEGSQRGSTPHPPQGRTRLPKSASLPRKSTVPWLRHPEEAGVGQRQRYALQPLEKHGRQIAELRAELAEAREKQHLFEQQLEAMAAQNQLLLEERASLHEQEDQLRGQLQETKSHLAQLSSRVTAAEGTRKKDQEKLRASEEKTKRLERRLSAMETEHAKLLQAVGQLLGRCAQQPNSLV